MSAANANTVVIGAKGFVGSAIIRRVECVGLSRQDVDLATPDSLAAVDGKVVIFTASTMPVRRQEDTAFQTNLDMLDPLLRARPRFICYLSTDALYPFDVTVTEKTEPAPITAYAKMHLEREMALQAKFADRLLIVRMCQIFGPGDPHNAYGPMRMLRDACKTKRIFVFGQGEERRDHLYVDDAAEAICALTKAKHLGVINLATGTSETFADVARMVAEQVPCQIDHLPRQQPVAHRDIDISALRLAHPTFAPRGLTKGLQQTVQRMLRDE